MRQALQRYRRAYKIAPDVETLLSRITPNNSVTVAQQTPANDLDVRGPEDATKELPPQSVEELLDGLRRMHLSVLPTTLLKTRHIGDLPSEIITDYILCRLIEIDPASVEAFGMVSLHCIETAR